MENNAFGSAHIPSQALVVLSEAASGLHEALRGQRPFPSRLPDAKDLHNMSLVGSYGTHLLHSFHPHLLQTLNHHGILAANGSTAAAASYFANDRTGLTKPLTNFQLPSAFSPPKYIGISLDQNLFNGSDSFRTDSASPTCTSHESLEGSNDYDGEKGESPRSNASDPRDLRHVHSKASSTCAPSMTVSAAATAAAVASIASSSAVVAATTATVAAASHLAQQSHAHHHPPHHHHHHHPAHHLAGINNHHHAHHTNGSLLAAASMTHTLNLAASHACGSLRPLPGHVPDVCPICGLKLTNEEWNSHFLTELDRLYKLSSGMERASLQATYMFAPPCPAQENAIRTSHSRWETFQRIRNNRQNRLRLKVRKRKYGDMFFMENMLCSSCPICKRKYGVDNLSGNRPGDEDRDHKMQDDIETVDVESCNDEMPDSGTELQHHQQHLRVTTGHAHMSTLSGSSSNHSHTNLNGANLHNSNSQPGKLDGILYRTTSLAISKDHNNTSGGGGGGEGEEDDNTNIATATTITSSTVSNGSSGSNSGQGDVNNWPDLTHGNSNNNNQAHISVKNVNELSSTTYTAPNSSHHYYHNADSCHEEHQQHQHHQQQHGKEAIGVDMCNNDSDEDVIVDDEESFKISSFNSQHSHQHNRKRKYEDAVMGSSSRIIANQHSPLEERPGSEPQVTSTECNLEMHHNNNNNNNNSNNNNNNNTKYLAFEDLRMKPSPDSESLAGSQQQQHQQAHALTAANLTHLDSSTTAKVGISSDLKSDIEENKCFICKTGIKDLTATDNFLRGRNFYFHQSCANVMSSYRFNKDLPAAATTTTAASVNPLLLTAHSQKYTTSQAAIVPTSPKDKINQQQKQQHIILEATNENQN